jgi:hypothetical protein
MRKQAAEMYVDGGDIRRNARHLKVGPLMIAFWVTDLAKALPHALIPEEV